MAGTIRDIPALLHDARLSECRWDRYLHTLHLVFRCLRRNVDGTPVEDDTVELKLDGVERIAAHYSPANVLVRPSEFEPTSRIEAADLEDWPRDPTEAHLAIDSPQAAFEAATACVRELLFGEPDEGRSDSPLRVHLTFEPHNYGPQGMASGLCVDCDSIEPFSGGVPLPVEAWERQFEAWWAGWRDHWSAKGRDSDGKSEPTLEDVFIPAAPDDPPDLSYRPPVAAPFLLSSSTALADLLKSIEDYHTGVYERDWLRVAGACPYFDLTLDERADQLRERFLGPEYGRWVYVRHVDDWWCEGNRACVVVRGIEHTIGDNESPARNEETVITYGLRQFRGAWILATWSQGWPRYGSADKLSDDQTWLDGWDLAK